MRNNTDLSGIVTAESGAAYEGLRALWCDTFGDEPSYVDSFYNNFGSDIKGYAVLDKNGAVCSALTCYLCGSFEESPVYVSYAVCTREDMRGQGLAGKLTDFVREKVTRAGGISIVSPAEPSLEGFYAEHGYRPFFFAAERAVMSPAFDEDEYEIFDEFDMDLGDDRGPEDIVPHVDIRRIPLSAYNRYREEFLSGRPHVKLSNAMLSLVAMESEGLYSINRGDAICAVSEKGDGRVVMSELLLDPALQELSNDIDGEIASMAAEYFGADETVYRMPGGESCQTMAAGSAVMPAEDHKECSNTDLGPYFGFPID